MIVNIRECDSCKTQQALDKKYIKIALSLDEIDYNTIQHHIDADKEVCSVKCATAILGEALRMLVDARNNA